jgi:hypothetical protein
MTERPARRGLLDRPVHRLPSQLIGFAAFAERFGLV